MPSFNHTREDSPLTPCPICKEEMETARRDIDIKNYLCRLRAEIFNLAWGERKREVESLMDEMRKFI